MKMLTMKSPLFFLAIVSIIFLSVLHHNFCFSQTVNDRDVYKIGILAKRGGHAALLKWKATADYLSETIDGYQFQIVPLAFDEISDAVLHNKIQFILTNPAIFLTLSTENGVKPLVTLSNLRKGSGYSKFGGVIFVRADSDINFYTDLKNSSFVAVSPSSLGGWLMALRELKKNKITPAGNIDDVEFVGTHDDVVFAVRDGRFDAGTVRTDTLERMEEEGKINIKDFRVLLKHIYYPTEEFPFLRSTPLYPEWPFAATNSVPDKLNKKIAIALLNMPSDSKAAIDASISGWDVVRNYQPIHELEQDLRMGPYKRISYLNYKDVIATYKYQITIGIIVFIFNIFLLYFLFHFKRMLNDDIARRKEIENVLKTINKRYYHEMMKYAKKGE